MISGRISTMEQGLRWDWETFPSGWTAWPSIHWASMWAPWCPLTPLRLYVMGIDESCERVHATRGGNTPDASPRA